MLVPRQSVTQSVVGMPALQPAASSPESSGSASLSGTAGSRLESTAHGLESGGAREAD